MRIGWIVCVHQALEFAKTEEINFTQSTDQHSRKQFVFDFCHNLKAFRLPSVGVVDRAGQVEQTYRQGGRFTY